MPGEGNGNPLQCSCLENSTNRGIWRATVHGATKEWDTAESLDSNNWMWNPEGATRKGPQLCETIPISAQPSPDREKPPNNREWRSVLQNNQLVLIKRVKAMTPRDTPRECPRLKVEQETHLIQSGSWSGL